eukprot:SAG11_NODE_2219_length_3674_cov_3.448951_2_plen_172_part_00
MPNGPSQSSGGLNRNELRDAMYQAAVGSFLTRGTYAGSMLERADLDGDGEVKLHEIEQVIEAYRASVEVPPDSSAARRAEAAAARAKMLAAAAARPCGGEACAQCATSSACAAYESCVWNQEVGTEQCHQRWITIFGSVYDMLNASNTTSRTGEPLVLPPPPTWEDDDSDL